METPRCVSTHATHAGTARAASANVRRVRHAPCATGHATYNNRQLYSELGHVLASRATCLPLAIFAAHTYTLSMPT
eukprot:362860-Chlamydomonas_euryale.AAC.7